MFKYLHHLSSFFKWENFGRVSLMLFITIVVGTVFYHYVEGWSWLNSYYFSVMTLTTVGYGDMVPSNPISKIFTTIYILGGLGIILNFVSVFYEYRILLFEKINKKADDISEEIKDDIEKIK